MLHDAINTFEQLLLELEISEYDFIEAMNQINYSANEYYDEDIVEFDYLINTYKLYPVLFTMKYTVMQILLIQIIIRQDLKQ